MAWRWSMDAEQEFRRDGERVAIRRKGRTRAASG